MFSLRSVHEVETIRGFLFAVKASSLQEAIDLGNTYNLSLSFVLQ
jgi:hypothetical protein